MARFTQQNGTEISMPDIKDIDLEIVEYWQKKRPGDKLVESLFAR